MKYIFLSYLIIFLSACGSNNLQTTEEILSKKVVPVLIEEPYYIQQWYLHEDKNFYKKNTIDINAHIHAKDMLQYYKGEGIRIAVIDDGLDRYHEDLFGAVVGTYDLSTKSNDVSHSLKDEFHGTAVTGLIAARQNSKGILGIASKSSIIFLKYKENMTDSEVIALFNKAEEFGADIINNSWGSYNVSEAVRARIVDLATNGRNGKGIIIVFASGNDDRDMGNDESSIDEVISVGATDRENLRTFYSNFGVNLDIMAPGGYWLGITTLDDSLSKGIATKDENYILFDDANAFNGTSAAAPIVSGIIALMLEKNPNLTRQEIENILKNNADKIGNVPYINGKNLYYGYGKINLSKVMEVI